MVGLGVYFPYLGQSQAELMTETLQLPKIQTTLHRTFPVHYRQVWPDLHVSTSHLAGERRVRPRHSQRVLGPGEEVGRLCETELSFLAKQIKFKVRQLVLM